nr:MAG TPA: hypothetical protein [Caudoviricetes sp.]
MQYYINCGQLLLAICITIKVYASSILAIGKGE